VTDAAGNVGPASATALSLTKDTVAPTIGSTGNSVDFSSPNYSLTFSFTELGSGLVALHYGNSASSGDTSTSSFVAISPAQTGTDYSYTTSSLSGVDSANQYFTFTLEDAAGNVSSAKQLTWNGGSLAFKGLMASGTARASSSAAASAASSSPRPAFAFPSYLVSFVEPAASSRAGAADPAAARDSEGGVAPVEARYALPATTRSSSIDASAFSLLRRSATAKGGSSEPAGKASPSALPATTSSARGSAPSDTSRSVPVSAASIQARSVASGSASAPATEPQPQLPKGPSAPAGAPAQGIDLYMGQPKGRREEFQSPCDEPDGRTIL
jgi:hypothetical protein